MDFLKDFDRSIKQMKKKAGGKPGLMAEVKALEARRPELVEALLSKNTKGTMEVLEEAFRVEKKVYGSKGTPGGEPEEAAGRGEPEEEERAWDKQRLKEIEKELRKIEKESEKIRGDWAKLEGIQGSYRELIVKIKSIEEEVSRMVEERKGFSQGVKKIKGELDSVHAPSKAVLTQEAYDQFWNELLQLSVKLAEMEELLEKNERVTETDLRELQGSVDGLARKLESIEWVASKKG